MRRIGIAFLFVLLCTAPLASARKAIDITPGSIIGIKLGMTHAQARTLLGKPVRVDRLEYGYDRLVSERKKVEAYFRAGAKGVVVVTTWSRARRTDGQVGPCSTAAALKAAYGSRLRPFRQAGKAIAYRLGNLIFATPSDTRVTAVAIGRGTAAIYVALNVPACR
jgi:hypothetical protein